MATPHLVRRPPPPMQSIKRQEWRKSSNPWQAAPCSVFHTPHSNGGRAMTEPTDVDDDLALPSRRRFLREGGVLVGGAVMAGGLAGGEALAAGDNADHLPPNVPEWIKTPGAPVGSPPHGTPLPLDKGLRNTHP